MMGGSRFGPGPAAASAGLLLMLAAASGCRLLDRPNPQLPPELRPKEGPTAATAALDEAPPAAAPQRTKPAAPAAELPATSAPTRTVALPTAPAPGEGKSGRLLIEPMDVEPEQRELTPIPDDPEFRRALRSWDEGPVRYIILKEEQDLFRKLTTDEDRLAFVMNFWSRRDRNPETPDNEYRLEFWRRVSEAERRFIDAPVPGWKSDRGRIWILLGPPDETDDQRMRGKGAEVLRWIYRNRPNYFLEPNFIVAFRRTYSGMWELSNDPRDFDTVFRDIRSSVQPYILSNNPVADLYPNLGAEIQLPSTTLLSLYMDLGQATAPPELYRARDREAVVETREIFGAMDLRTSFEFLGPTPGGTVRTGIVLGILKSSLISETDSEEADSDLDIDMSVYMGDSQDLENVVRVPRAFGASRENYVATLNQRLLFRNELELEPGTYLAVYRLLDRSTGQAAQARETFTVPSRFEEGLQLSTLVLARNLSPLDPARERADSFTLGKFRVVPNLDATYRNGETLAFYYQVSGADFDPRTGQRRMDVEYSFAVQQDDGWLELGEALLYRDQSNPQAWSVPLRGWPPANYRLRVRISDMVSGRRVENDAFFRVVPGA